MRLSIFLASLVLTAAISAQASLAHLQSNIAYSIAAYARVLAAGLSTSPDTEAALREVSSAYDALGLMLESSPVSSENVDICFMVAQAALDQFLTNAKSISLSHQRIVATMLSQNERLISTLP